MTTDQVLAAMRAAVAAGGSPEDVLAAARRAAVRTAGGAPADPPPASTAYRAAEGDVLDAVAHAFYGAEAAVTSLLVSNQPLAVQPPHLPAGALVGLPPVDLPAPEVRAVQIWD